jgi:hypothetical protein
LLGVQKVKDVQQFRFVQQSEESVYTSKNWVAIWFQMGHLHIVLSDVVFYIRGPFASMFVVINKSLVD